MSVRLGGHGLPVGPDDPAAFARAHRDFGYGAAYCPELSLADAPRLRAVEAAFKAENVTIAEYGIWRNLTAIEPDRKKAHRDRAKECLAVADEVGCLCAVSYIGTFAPNSDYAPHPDNMGQKAFDACVEAARDIIDSVKPKRAKFALEMMQYALPDSIDSYLDLLKAIDRPAFGVHVDPVNLIMTPRRYFDNGAYITEIFDRLGPWIVSCHAKDIILHHQAALHLDECQIGEGVLDYKAFLRAIAKLGRDVPLMLEHLDGPAYAVARDRIQAVAKAEGIALT